MAILFLSKPMYHTYILYSESAGIYYTGSTSNLEDRFLRHNSNRNKYTRGKGPWKLIKSYEFTTRSEAVQLEMKIKKRGAGRFLQEQGA